ncbi:TAXI family TRAP transporter solute-binding subunit [Spongiactinospora sp. TRM90649]|uniref:TAXI family TRAP transporter solute-binding subunit n=1 Tax=Spongiactinospora sp. TRM90649 TaxID=3031114 RepID=UPI0023F73676|nr:TAXI family TRAP transporter solute-binding subunit [Spongiactinospora sp. TRM90649]MDF5755851.1 TAXI family TRAP transporter solute-binding subunit [Spongiactinospora sp. TRM90649]
MRAPFAPCSPGPRLVLGPVALLVLLLTAITACGSGTAPGGQAPYAGGRLSIATGNTTGVYYQLGGGYADLISRSLPGYQATAEATGASVENIQRVARGDSDIAFTLADVAADAATGRGAFTSPQPIKALARIYPNHTHVIARADSGIRSVAGMRGKRISTGSPNSGTEVIARRLLAAAELNPATDIRGQALSLPETVQGIKDGTLDALFWSGGLPTGGITDLTVSMKDQVVFVPVADLLPKLRAEYGQVYQESRIGKAVYGTPSDVPGISVPNLLVVSDSMPGPLARDLTRLLFDHRDELAKVHPEAGNIERAVAARTEPVPLHPGASDYYANR